MGITFANVTISNIADPKRSFTDRFNVDTGATDTLVPARLLRQIGIKPAQRRSYKPATGKKRYPVGHALIGVEGGPCNSTEPIAAGNAGQSHRRKGSDPFCHGLPCPAGGSLTRPRPPARGNPLGGSGLF